MNNKMEKLGFYRNMKKAPVCVKCGATMEEWK